MMNFTRSAAAVLLTCVAVASPLFAETGDATASKKILLSFGPDYDLSHPKTNHGGEWKLSPAGRPALQLTTPPGRDWPGILFNAPGGAWDLSAYEYISLDIHNVDNKDIDVFVRVDNPGADGRVNCISERAFVAPDQRTTITVPLKRISNSPVKLWGMHGYPQGLYPNSTGLDCSNIVAIVVYTGTASLTPNSFEISNVYAAGKFQPPTWMDMTPDEFFPFVDKFGQFKHKDWPGKVHDESELIAQRDAEAAQLAADAGPREWNKWGGWANGPQLDATGHFRTAKHDGRWWLVDPDGRLFFSTGLCSVRTGWAATPIEERDGWFTDLPAQDGEFKEFFSKSYRLWSGKYAGKEPVMFDFSSVNLKRKYGGDWKKVYPEIVHKRLRAWGINTMANWSDGRWARMGRTPYMSTMFYERPKMLRKTGSGFYDVFDPKFAANVAAGAKQWITPMKDDPWCVGFFVDNEMPWGGRTQIAIEALRGEKGQPAKLALTDWLRERYSSIDALNQAWGTGFASFDDFPVDPKYKAPITEAATKDFTDFTTLAAEKYYKTVRDAIKAIAPDKLYLGCRSVGAAPNIASMAVKYCDVVSFNRYAHSVRDQKLPGDLDAPTLIGEFHFGASDRGLFWNGLVSTDSQIDRARKYIDYVNSALDNPQIVGVHWFQYGDQAVTGRGDGENAQCGFVDICDAPYVETVKAAREVGETMYSRRAAVK